MAIMSRLVHLTRPNQSLQPTAGWRFALSSRFLCEIQVASKIFSSVLQSIRVRHRHILSRRVYLFALIR
jgi:hypothetical protein